MTVDEERAAFCQRVHQALRDAGVLSRSLENALQVVGTNVESMELHIHREQAMDICDQLQDRLMLVASELPSRER